MRNGKTGLTFEKSSPDESKLKLSNSQITNMGEHLFSARNCKIEVTNTELTNAGGGVVVLIGGNYCFRPLYACQFHDIGKTDHALPHDGKQCE